MLTLPVMFAVRHYTMKTERDRKAVILSFFVLLMIILALRDNTVGTDIANYLRHFRTLAATPWSKIFTVTRLEPGYVVFNKVVSLISTNDRWFLAVMALITVLPIYWLYLKESQLPLMSIVLFLTVGTFVMLFSGLRQSIAIALGVISFWYAKEKRLIPFLMLCLLASSFHISALIVLLLYPICNVRVNRLTAALLLVTAGIVFIFRERIFLALLKFLPDEYQRYGMQSTGAYSVLILLTAFCIFALIVIDDKTKGRHLYLWRNLLLVCLFIQIFASVSTMAMRYNYYFLAIVPIAIPAVVEYEKEKYHGFMKVMMLIAEIAISLFFLSYFFYHTGMDADVLNVYPYLPFWGSIN